MVANQKKAVLKDCIKQLSCCTEPSLSQIGIIFELNCGGWDIFATDFVLIPQQGLNIFQNPIKEHEYEVRREMKLQGDKKQEMEMMTGTHFATFSL